MDTGTRGGNILSDMDAKIISLTLATGGLSLSKQLFDMWYFDNRSEPYFLSGSEWKAAAAYAQSNVGQGYKNFQGQLYEGAIYYPNAVNYYNAGVDMGFSYGAATVFFSTKGIPSGFYDMYNFNAGDRSILPETLTAIIRHLGGEGGFDILYGIYWR